MKILVRVMFILISTTLIFTCGAFADERPFEGQTIRVVSEDVLITSARMFREEWEEKTGARVVLTEYPYGELYESLVTPLITGVAAFDIILFPGTWTAEFAANEWLTPLDDYVAEVDEWWEYDDILDIYKEFGIWEDQIVTIIADGDTHLVYYRKDAIEDPEYQEQFQAVYGYELQPPLTWAEYKDIAEFFHGWDWDGDGRTNHGAAEARRRDGQAVWTFFTRAASYVSLPDQPGGLYFDPEDMTPRINSTGHVRALEDYLEIIEFGPPGMEDYMVGDVREGWYVGRYTLGIDWGDTGTFAAVAPGTVVADKTGYVLQPGTTEVWNFAEEAWVEVPEVNHAPFLAFGGWVYGIPYFAQNVEAAFDFIAFLTSADISLICATTEGTGIDPFRHSHYENLEPWYEFGFVNPDEFLDVYQQHQTHPNAQMDLMIPGMARYQEALDFELAQAVAGSKTPQQALDDAARAWDRITDDLGREQQLELYREALGLD